MNPARPPPPEQTAAPSIAFVLGEFPSLSETFIPRELDALEAAGWRPCVYALAAGRPPVVHAAARRRIPSLHYPPPSATPRACAHAWRAMFRRDAARARRWQRRMLLAGCRFPRLIARIARRLPAVCALGGAAIDGRVRYIHAHFATLPAEVAWAAAWFGGCPFGFTAHARDIFVQPPALLRLKIADAALVTACTAVHLRFLRGAAPDAPRTRLALVYHGTILPAADGPPPAPETGRLLAVGRLVPKKAFDTLIQACAIMAAKGIAFDVEIVGEGPERPRLASMIRESGLAGRITLAGAVAHEDMAAVYRRASLAAVTARVMPDGDRDGIPNVLLEAMARGLAVVATDTPAVREVVRDGLNACLTPPENPGRLAGTLAGLLADAGKRAALGARAAETVRRRFDAGKHARRLRARLSAAALHGVAPGVRH